MSKNWGEGVDFFFKEKKYIIFPLNSIRHIIVRDKLAGLEKEANRLLSCRLEKYVENAESIKAMASVQGLGSARCWITLLLDSSDCGRKGLSVKVDNLIIISHNIVTS